MIHIKQRSNQRIEACRFLACSMVLFCHVPFPRPYGSCVEALARFAVPFCLMIPGCFTFDDKLAAKSWKKPRNTVETVVVAGAFCLIAARLRLNLNRCRLPLSLALTICAWLINSFTSKDWYYSGNALFTGIPMFLIGQHLRACPDPVRRVKGRELPLIALGLLLALIEYRITHTGGYIYSGQILVAAALLCMCLNRPDKPAPRCLVFPGSSCSLYIMVVHCKIRDTLALWMDKNIWYFPLVALAFSIALASLISWLNARLNPASRRSSSH